jgi:hypothetical protein
MQYASCEVEQEHWVCILNDNATLTGVLQDGVVMQLDSKPWTEDELRVGTRIEVYCDKSSTWSKGIIVANQEGRFKIHYQGWNKRYDEWLKKDQTGFNRIATMGTHIFN